MISHGLAPRSPPLAAEYFAALNREAEFGLARLSGVAAAADHSERGIVVEMTSRKKNRSFSYQRYVELLTN